VGVATIEKVIQLCAQGGKLEDAFNLSILYLSSPDLSREDRCADADRVAAQAVKLSLSLPKCYDWDLLEDVVPISQYLKSNPDGKTTYSKLISLLKSPTTKFDQIEQELKSNAQLQSALSEDAKSWVKRKSRLLSLTDLCGSRVGGEVKYFEVKECLGLTVPIEEDDGMEVEEWVINGRCSFSLCHVLSTYSSNPILFFVFCFFYCSCQGEFDHCQAPSTQPRDLCDQGQPPIIRCTPMGHPPNENERVGQLDRASHSRRGTRPFFRRIFFKS
jgi:hypothetical protein